MGTENADAVAKAVAALSKSLPKVGAAAADAADAVVALAGKPGKGGNKIRRVRTPEGQKRFKQPIGSVIITDGDGNVLKVLHSGNGALNNSPAMATYQGYGGAASAFDAVPEKPTDKFTDNLPEHKPKTDTSTKTAAPGQWLVTSWGTQNTLDVKPGDRVFKQGMSTYYVQSKSGTVKKFDKEDTWGYSVSSVPSTAKEIFDSESYKAPTVKDSFYELSAKDNKNITAISKVVGGSPDEFSKLSVGTPEGPLAVYVTPEAEVYTTKTGVLVKYNDSDNGTVSFTQSGKINKANSIPSTAYKVPFDAPETPNVPDADAPNVPDTDVPEAPAAPQTKTQAVAEAASKVAGVSHVKATKDKNASTADVNIWNVTSHKDAGGNAYTIRNPKKGGTEVYVGDDKVAGPFTKVSEAKAWIDTNGTAESAPKPAQAAPQVSAPDNAPQAPSAPQVPSTGVPHIKATKNKDKSTADVAFWDVTSHTDADGNAYEIVNPKKGDATVHVNGVQQGASHKTVKDAKVWIDANGTAKGGTPSTPATSDETNVPQTTAPQTTAPQTTAPQTTAPQTTAPQTAAPQTTAPQTTAPQTKTQAVAEAAEKIDVSSVKATKNKDASTDSMAVWNVISHEPEGGGSFFIRNPKKGDTEVWADNDKVAGPFKTVKDAKKWITDNGVEKGKVASVTQPEQPQDTPEAPSTPDVPEQPQDTPEAPSTPDVPEAVSEPDTPEAPSTPDVPEAVSEPDTSSADTPESPAALDVAEDDSSKSIKSMLVHPNGDKLYAVEGYKAFQAPSGYVAVTNDGDALVYSPGSPDGYNVGKADIDDLASKYPEVDLDTGKVKNSPEEKSQPTVATGAPKFVETPTPDVMKSTTTPEVVETPKFYTASDVAVTASAIGGWKTVGFTDPDTKQPYIISKHPYGDGWTVTSDEQTKKYYVSTLKAGKAWVAENGVAAASVSEKKAAVKKKTATKTKKVKGAPVVAEWEGMKVVVPPGHTLTSYEGKAYLFNTYGQDYAELLPDGSLTGHYGKNGHPAVKGGTKVASSPSATYGKYESSDYDKAALAAKLNAVLDNNQDSYYYTGYSKDLSMVLSGDTQSVSVYSVSHMMSRVSQVMFDDTSETPFTDIKPFVDAVYDLVAKGGQFESAVSNKRKHEYEKTARFVSVAAKIEAGEEVPYDDLQWLRQRADLSIHLNGTKWNDPANQMRKKMSEQLYAVFGASVDMDPTSDDSIREYAHKVGFQLADGLTDIETARSWLKAHIEGSVLPATMRKTLTKKIFQSKLDLKNYYETITPDVDTAGPIAPDGNYTVPSTLSHANLLETEFAWAIPGSTNLGAVPESDLATFHNEGGLFPILVVGHKGSAGSLPSGMADALYAKFYKAGGPEQAAAEDGVGSTFGKDIYAKAYKVLEGGYAKPKPYVPSVVKESAAWDAEHAQKAEKPDSVPSQDWATVQAVLDDPKLIPGFSAEAESFTTPEGWAQRTALPPSFFEKGDDALKALAIMGQNDLIEWGYLSSAVKEIALTGRWGAPYDQKYESEKLAAPLFLKKGDDVYSYGSIGILVKNSLTGNAYLVKKSFNGTSNNYTNNVPDYYFDNISVQKIHGVPPVIDHKFVAESLADKYDITEAEYTAFDAATKAKSFAEVAPDFTKGDALISAKGYLTAPANTEAFPHLTGVSLPNMPDGVLAAVSNAFAKQDSHTLAIADLYAQYNLFDKSDTADDPLQHFQNIGLSPHKGYWKHIEAGAIDYDSLFAMWEHGDVEAAAVDLGLPTSAAYDTLAAALAEANKQVKPKSFAKVGHNKALDDLELTLTSKGSPGGAHTKTIWADQYGNEWMKKTFPSDPVNGDSRIDAEHAGNEIGRLYGFNSPTTKTMQLGGDYSYVQFMAPAKGDVKKLTWDEIPETAVGDILSAHVLNWAISNHDGHGGNFMLTPDGAHAFPIDLGQSTKFFPNDKLEVGYNPNAAYGEVIWYDHVYDAITSKKMSREQADRIRDRVLRKAAEVSTRNEDAYRAILEKSVEKRKQFPKQYPTSEKFVDAMMQRRADAFDDFLGFYQNLYTKAGYDWDAGTSVDDFLPKKIGKVHASPTAEFAADVAKSGSHGQALLFAGSTFADQHMMVHVSQGKKIKGGGAAAGKTLHAQATLLPEADKVFVDWMSQHTVEKISTPEPATPQTTAQQAKQLPMLGNWHSSLVAYAKTVATHAGDGNYTASTVNQANLAQDALKTALAKVKADIEADPKGLPSVAGVKFLTHEQRDTWVTNAEIMVERFGMVDVAKAKGVKVSEEYPDYGKFELPEYAPTKGLNTSGEPGVKHAYTWNGDTYEQYDTGGYFKTDSNGTVTQVTQGDFSEASVNGTKVGDAEPSTADVEPLEETENVVAAANKIVKVKLQQAKAFAGALDLENFTMTEYSGSTQMTGQEFEIEYDNIVMRYQPFDSKYGATKPQRGLLRIEAREWDEQPQSIDSVIQVLRDIGLDLTEADETSLQVNYFRQLHGVAMDRISTPKTDAAIAAGKKIPATGDQSELDAWKKVWSDYYGADKVDAFLDKDEYKPVLGERADGMSVGPPQYRRIDSSVADYRKITGGRLPVHYTAAGGAGDPNEIDYSMALSGFAGTEERIRVLGKWVGGMSSPEDQKAGSSKYTFWRQGKNLEKSHHHIYLEPDYASMLTNYAYKTDHFGRASLKQSQAPFGTEDQANLGENRNGAGNNELLIKQFVPPSAFAFMVVSAEVRKRILKAYENMGIDELGGVPIEKKFLTSDMVNEKVVQEVWDRAEQREADRKKNGVA